MKAEHIARLKAMADAIRAIQEELAHIAAYYEATGEQGPIPADGATGIAALREGQTNVEIAGTIDGISNVTEYRKADGSAGRLRTITLHDATGRVAIPLWDAQIDAFSWLKVGDEVVVKAWRVKRYDKQLQLQLGKYGSITKADQGVLE